MKQLAYSDKAYNALPDVESAYDELVSSFDLRVVLAEAAQVFRRHSMGGLGLFLLHRHFDVARGEIVVEERRKICGGGYELVSKARRVVPDSRVGVAASRWLFCGTSRLRPIEYSRDDFVRNGNRILAERPRFVDELGEFLHRQGLVGRMGLAVARREGVLLGDGEVFVETTNLADRESVLQALGLDQAGAKRAIPTLWTHEDGDCWCEPQTVCNVLCARNNQTGVHGKAHVGYPTKTGHEKVPCA